MTENENVKLMAEENERKQALAMVPDQEMVTSAPPTQLPQGDNTLLKLEEQTPLMRQYLLFKQKVGEALLFFRVGDFYELFFDDAKRVHQLLGLTLTQRGFSGPNPISMAGVPWMALETHLAKLVKMGVSAAVVDQVGEVTNKGPVERALTRILSASTILEDQYLDPTSNPVLLCVFPMESAKEQASFDVMLAWGSLSTGNVCFKPIASRMLFDEIAKIRPSEIIHPDTLTLQLPSGVSKSALPTYQFHVQTGVSLIKAAFEQHPFLLKALPIYSLLEGGSLGVARSGQKDQERDEDGDGLFMGSQGQAAMPQKSPWDYLYERYSGSGQDLFAGEESAALRRLVKTSAHMRSDILKALCAVLGYWSGSLAGRSISLYKISLEQESDRLWMDSDTRRALEVEQTASDSKRNAAGSLAHEIIGGANSAIGKRVLLDLLNSPMYDYQPIALRVGLQCCLGALPLNLRSAVSGLLSECFDLQRIAMRAQSGLNRPRDFASLKQTLVKTKSIVEHLKGQEAFLKTISSAATFASFSSVLLEGAAQRAPATYFAHALEEPFAKKVEEKVFSLNGTMPWGALQKTLAERFSPLGEVIDYIQSSLRSLEPLGQWLEEAISDEAPVHIKDGGFTKKGYNTDLDEARELFEHGDEAILAFEQEQKEKTGISTLKVEDTKGFGYCITVSKGALDKVPSYYVRRASLKNAERFTCEQLKELEVKVGAAESKMSKLEKQLFEQAQGVLKQHARSLQEAAKTLGHLDALLTLAEFMKNTGGCYPMLEGKGVRQNMHLLLEHCTRDKEVAALLGSTIVGSQSPNALVKALKDQISAWAESLFAEQMSSVHLEPKIVSKVIVSQSLLQAMVKEKQVSRPYNAEQKQLDAQVQQRVQDQLRSPYLKNAAGEVPALGSLWIEDLEHPVLRRQSGFVANDLKLSKEQSLLITGPNMGGKSTYMRSAALCILMAQCGMSVCAKKARLPLYDKLFARIGAHDDISRGQSTFMVEMSQTSNMLHSATEHSFCLIDEIGRGTSTYDGVCIAFGALKHLVEHNRAQCLFSTHYFELTHLVHEEEGEGVERQAEPPKMEGSQSKGEFLGFDLKIQSGKLKQVHLEALHTEEGLVFTHKVKKGATDKSYGLEVAKMAAIPPLALEYARSLSEHLSEVQGEAGPLMSPKGTVESLQKGSAEEIAPTKNVGTNEAIAAGGEKTQGKLQQESKESLRAQALIEDLAQLQIDDLSPKQAYFLLEQWIEKAQALKS